MKKAVLIVNPSSGGEKAKEFETLAEEKLKQLFDEVVVKQTEKGGDAEQFAREEICGKSLRQCFRNGGRWNR